MSLRNIVILLILGAFSLALSSGAFQPPPAHAEEEKWVLMETRISPASGVLEWTSGKPLGEKP